MAGAEGSDGAHASAFWSELFERSMRDAAPEADGPSVASLAEAARQLGEIERRYRALFEHAPVSVYVCDAADPERFRYVNPRIEELLGFGRARWIEERNFRWERVHREDRDHAREATANAGAQGAPLRIDYRMTHRDGSDVWVRDECSPAPGELRVGVLTALERAPEAGGAQSFVLSHDPVTRLPNRGLLAEHLRLAIARAADEDRHVALLHVDLDDFRLVNESLGHEAGDRALRQVADRLRELTLSTQLVARHGSDEFLLLAPDLKPGSADELAEIIAGQVSAALEEPLRVDGHELTLTASIGASVYPRDARDAGDLLRHAAAASADARETSGRGGFALYAGATIEALERLSLPARLRRALERDEFVLHYQPIYSLMEDELVGVEALIRWLDPERGLIPPLDFIPVAEYTGLIEPIGDWVIDAVCEQARAWGAEGLRPRISFNASLKQFCGSGFAQSVGRRLDGQGLDPSCFILEVTESTVMQEPGRVEPVLRELADLGVRIAIDDFGVGYSSLGRLQHMPVQLLKIDRSFLAGAPEAEGATRVVGAAIELVRALGMEAVAEGVENEAQHRFLRERGCALAQGFHLARPMAPEDVEPLLRGGEPVAAPAP